MLQEIQSARSRRPLDSNRNSTYEHYFLCHPSLQVDGSRYGDPFVFATFRSLCSWLAEETSCLKEEVTQLLPFLVGYARNHMRQGDGPEQSLAQWMAELSLSDETAVWSGREALR